MSPILEYPAPDSAQAAGCTGFIRKPCLPDDLVREVREALQRARQAS